MKRFGVLFFLFSASAFANPCTNISFPRQALGPVRDQGISGLCFAYEAADLISYKTEKRVSALDLAFAYFQSIEKFKKMADVYQNGGETGPTIAATTSRGVCLEEDVPSEETIVDDAKQLGKIQSSFARLDKISWNSDEAARLAKELFPRLQKSDFTAASLIKKKKERLAYLEQAACSKRVETASLKFVYREIGKTFSRYDGLKLIDEQMDRANPVGIGFHSNDLFVLKDADNRHAATLIGRRWNEGRGSCEYLLRDTFGEQCDSYKGRFECDRGTIWIDTAFLEKALFEVEYID
jgi:hypothetical protein